MKKRTVFVIACTILLMLTAFVGIISAQDIDLSDMDNAQLLQLLQAIMLKLEAEETEETAEPFPTGTEMPVISVARFSDGKLFQIYDNKKLIIEAIPGYMFYQAPEETSEPDNHTHNDGGDDNAHGWVTDEHGCEPGQQWVCDIYGSCYCTWAKG